MNSYNLKKSINKMIELFAYDLKDLGACTVGEHVIITLHCAPVYTLPYRKAQKERETMQQEVNQMLELDIIEKSILPWNSPAIVVPKRTVHGVLLSTIGM